MILKPGQAVSDVRFTNGDNSVLIPLLPGTVTSDLTNSPNTVTWTPPA